jgi:hypothetical protein
MLKETGGALGLDPEEILTKEALAKPHRTVVMADRGDNQMETLLRAFEAEAQTRSCRNIHGSI